MDMIYEVEEESEIVEDLSMLAEGMKLLQYDYLGGHGSRGYGKVRFKDVQADTVVGELDEKLQQEIDQIFQGLM